MSVPARSLGAPARAPRPQVPPAPERPASSGSVRERPRARGWPVAFFVFASVVLGLMVVGVVALNALVAQTSFRVEELSERADELAERNGILTVDVAKAAAPRNVAVWAREHGLRLFEEFGYIPPTTGPSATAGETGTPGRGGASRKGVVGDGP